MARFVMNVNNQPGDYRAADVAAIHAAGCPGLGENCPCGPTTFVPLAVLTEALNGDPEGRARAVQVRASSERA